MPRLDGVLETALYVTDMVRAREFFEEVMGLTAFTASERISVYDAGGNTVLLLFLEGGTRDTVVLPDNMGTIPPHDGSGPVHMAFAVSTDALAEWEQHLAGHGVEIEGHTNWTRGGRSLYFRDPDGHLLELASPGVWPNY